MRLLTAMFLGASVLAAASHAITIDPATLVLRKVDIPAGFQVDEGNTGIRSNEREGAEDPTLRTKLRAWGRLTGYEANFDRPGGGMSSRADVFRSSTGARKMLAFYARLMLTSGIAGLERTSAAIGDQGWLYAGQSRSEYSVVVWRYRRVFAGVAVLGVTKRQTLALARAQQRRIAAALR